MSPFVSVFCWHWDKIPWILQENIFVCSTKLEGNCCIRCWFFRQEVDNKALSGRLGIKQSAPLRFASDDPRWTCSVSWSPTRQVLEIIIYNSRLFVYSVLALNLCLTRFVLHWQKTAASSRFYQMWKFSSVDFPTRGIRAARGHLWWCAADSERCPGDFFFHLTKRTVQWMDVVDESIWNLRYGGFHNVP